MTLLRITHPLYRKPRLMSIVLVSRHDHVYAASSGIMDEGRFMLLTVAIVILSTWAGPGVVLYWFGHAPKSRLHNAEGGVVIIGWDLPSRVMLPNGQIRTTD